MPKILLCEDGIEVELERDQAGLWVILRDPGQGTTLGRFAIDPSELAGTLKGSLSFQATDGAGNSVTFEGNPETLKVRLEGQGYSPKMCRLATEKVKAALEELNISAL